MSQKFSKKKSERNMLAGGVSGVGAIIGWAIPIAISILAFLLLWHDNLINFNLLTPVGQNQMHHVFHVVNNYMGSVNIQNWGKWCLIIVLCINLILIIGALVISFSLDENEVYGKYGKQTDNEKQNAKNNKTLNKVLGYRRTVIFFSIIYVLSILAYSVLPMLALIPATKGDISFFSCYEWTIIELACGSLSVVSYVMWGIYKHLWNKYTKSITQAE